MVSAVNVGTVNMPKVLRHLSHRSSQVRDLLFIRDAMYAKDSKNTKADASGIAGPAVNFGYETTSTTTQSVGTDKAYYTSTPELVLPGLKMLQSPISSRSGRMERGGHRINGACTFYAPSLTYIRTLDNFSETTQFNELETFDKLIDIERIIINPNSATYIGSSSNWEGGVYTATSATHTISFANATAGYEVDRLQFKIKTSGTLDYIQLSANQTLAGLQSASSASIKWDGTMALSSTDWITIDVPLRGVGNHSGAGGKNITTTSLYKDGTRYAFTASNVGGFDIDTLLGDSNNELSSLIIALSSSASTELKDIYLYKEAEWRIDTIKEYRDEYLQIGAVRVRGDSGSRRRAYG